jgi:hypothetical protein
MRTIFSTSRAGVVAALAVALPAAAQLPSPSAAALGVGDNFTAAARDYSAAAWNPALLALPGAARSSGTFPMVRGVAGFGPVTLGDLAEWEERVVPDAVKEGWLAAIRREGGQSGGAGGDLTILAAQYGRFATQLSTSVRAVSDVSPGVAELLLFGNADEEGNPRAIPLDGSTVSMHAYSTFAVSYAVPVPLRRRDARMGVGATATYTLGHALAVGGPSTGAASAEPVAIEFRFPVVHSDFGSDFRLVYGSGIGVDLGVGYAQGIWSFGGVLRNAVNTFGWNPAHLHYRDGAAVFDADRRASDFGARPLASAPPEARRLAEEATFRRSLAAGAMARWSPRLATTADLRLGAAGGIGDSPQRQVGAGVEFRPTPWLPLRAGGALVDGGAREGGVLLATGFGVEAGQWVMAASVARRAGDTLLMLNLLSVAR